MEPARSVEKMLQEDFFLKGDLNRKVNMNNGKLLITVLTNNPRFVEQVKATLDQDNTLFFISRVDDILCDQVKVHANLVLVDTELQDIDYCQTYNRLLEKLQKQQIPVVVIVDSEKDEILDCLNTGEIDYVTRPIRHNILRFRVQTLLELKQFQDHNHATKEFLPYLPDWQDCREEFNREWRRAIRAQTPQSLLIVEIDFFEAYQDFYGQTAGENCLYRIASLIEENAKRESDLVSQVKKDRFMILLPETDMNGALRVAHRIEDGIDAMNIAHLHSPISNNVTVSIGIATIIPKPKQEPTELITKALSLLEDAKLIKNNLINC